MCRMYGFRNPRAPLTTIYPGGFFDLPMHQDRGEVLHLRICMYFALQLYISSICSITNANKLVHVQYGMAL